MNTPLTLAMLLQAFEQHNKTFSPWSWLVYGLAIATLLLAFRPTDLSNRLIIGFLGFIWLWVGIAFFILTFAPIYPLAYLFGALFIVQGLAFLYLAGRAPLSFGFRTDIYGLIGLLLALFGLVGYPIFGYLMGDSFPQVAIVGAPCPATILTFGLLLMTRERVPWPVLIIPFLWAVSAVVPISAGMWADVVLLTGGIFGTVMIIYRDRHRALAESSIRPAH
ncbi:MAG: DUF6064 family protein [Chloroflexota bacterium]